MVNVVAVGFVVKSSFGCPSDRVTVTNVSNINGRAQTTNLGAPVDVRAHTLQRVA